VSTAVDTPPSALAPPPAPPPDARHERRREPTELHESPPGFGRYPWWAPLAALGTGLALLAVPLLALEDAGDVPFLATIGEGLFCAVLLGTAFILMKRTGGRPSAAALGLRATASRAAVGWIVVARLVYAIVAAIYISAVGHVTPNAPVAPVSGAHTLAAVDLVIAACVLAPVGEELFFRGFMYASLRGRLPAFWAALVTGALFGAVHPLFGASAWNLVPILAMAGFAMCLLYERTGSLWPAIAFHALMNIGVLYLVTGMVLLPLGIVGGAALLFLLAPWRLAQRVRT
jgi:uncharacterized protein